MVKEMHYEENTLIDLDPKIGQGGQGHTKCCPVPGPQLHVTYAPAKFDVATSYG